MILDRSQQNVALVELSGPVSDCMEVGLSSVAYEIHDEGDYPIVPSLHRVCWYALGNQTSVESLFCFASAMMPSSNMEVAGNVYASTNKYLLSEALQRLAKTTCQDHTSLSTTLHRLRELPEEILFLIWEFLPLTVIRRLISLQTSLNVMEQMTPIREWSGVFLLHGSITFFFRRLQGETYLCGLRNTYQQYGHKSDDYQHVLIEVPVVAVSSIVGLFGIKGIRYLMRDGNKGYIGSSIRNPENTRCVNITSPNTAEPLFLRLDGDVRSYLVPS